jgi:hypothetical protein
MHKTTCLLALVCVAASVSAQNRKISLSAYVGTGPSWYGGKDIAKSATYYSFNTFGSTDYVDRPYGNRMLNNWIAGARVTYWFPASTWDISLNAQVEYTGGRGTISREVSSTSGTRDVFGEYRISNDYISVNPQVGNVCRIGKVLLLPRIGVDYAIHAAGHEVYTVPDQNGLPYIKGYSGGTGRDDIRLTANMIFPVGKKWEFDIGYKHGLIKYAGYNAYLRMFHFKLGYAIIRPKMTSWGTPKF